MKKLLKHLVKSTTGLEDFSINESVEDGRILFTIVTKPDTAGLIIGKQGRTIKAIRSVLKIKATLDKKMVNISVEEEGKNKKE